MSTSSLTLMLRLFLAESLILNINATLTNDTTNTNLYQVSNINPNQVVISRNVFTVLIAASIGALLCCGCALLCFSIAICYYYKTNIHFNAQIDVEQHQRLQSPSIVSIPSSVGDSKYTQSEDNTEDNTMDTKSTQKTLSNTKSTKSLKLTLPQSNKDFHKLSLHHVHSYSINTHRLNELAEKQKKVTDGGDINDDNDNVGFDDKANLKPSKHCTFDSEELYIDVTKSCITITPRGDAAEIDRPSQNTNIATNSVQIDDIKLAENAEISGSSSTLTLPTLLGGPEGDGRMHEAKTEKKWYSESYTMDGHRRNLHSEGNILTKRDKQYEMNQHHIPDITLDSAIDIDVEDDCKSIHHHTLKQYRKGRKNKSGTKYQSDITSNDSENGNVLMGVDMNRNHISPFQRRGITRYHTQPNLKYVPKQQFMQHPQYLSMVNINMMNGQKRGDNKNIDIQTPPCFVRPNKTF